MQVLAGGAHATTFKVISSFASAKLGNPTTGVAPAASGTAIYGTLPGGNSPEPGRQCSKGCGGVYERLGGQTKVRFKFNYRDGGTPQAPLLVYSTSLYGTTLSGGKGKACGLFGCGVVFTIDASGKEHVLYSFCTKAKCADGYQPSGVIADGTGNLYGETSFNGPNNGGDIFELSNQGGTYTYTVLYAFCAQQNCTDGAQPNGGLLLDSSGTLYGTTMFGGTGSSCGTYTMPGCGTVFKLTQSGGVWTENVLYNFCPNSSCAGGSLPAAGLIEDGAGNLYGTTTLGGNGSCYLGCGTVFELATDGTETPLHAFQGGTDGETPLGGLALDASSGNLYGTTQAGGGNTDPSCTTQDSSCGTVFEVDATGKESVLHAFCPNPGCIGGAVPEYVTPVLLDKAIYGTTAYGGAAPNNFGTLWKLQP